MDKKDEQIFLVKNNYEAEFPEMSDIKAELSARFFVERFGVEHPIDSYCNEWGKRFSKGTEWYAMDGKSLQIYLRVLTTAWRGTARALHVDDLKKFLEVKE